MTIAAHRKSPSLQLSEYTMIADIRVAGIERAGLLQTAVEGHQRIIWLIGRLNSERREDTIKRPLCKRQQIAPPVKHMEVNAEGRRLRMCRDLLIGRDCVDLRIRTKSTQLSQLCRAVNDKDHQALCTSWHKLQESRLHCLASPYFAHADSIADHTLSV